MNIDIINLMKCQYKLNEIIKNADICHNIIDPINIHNCIKKHPLTKECMYLIEISKNEYKKAIEKVLYDLQKTDINISFFVEETYCNEILEKSTFYIYSKDLSKFSSITLPKSYKNKIIRYILKQECGNFLIDNFDNDFIHLIQPFPIQIKEYLEKFGIFKCNTDTVYKIENSDTTLTLMQLYGVI